MGEKTELTWLGLRQRPMTLQEKQQMDRKTLCSNRTGMTLETQGQLKTGGEERVML